MGLFDKAKAMLSGHKKEAKQGVDTAADQVEKVTPDSQDAKVEQASEAAKDAIDKLD